MPLLALFVSLPGGVPHFGHAAAPSTAIESPDGRNAVAVNVADDRVTFRVSRDRRLLMGPSPLGPELADPRAGPSKGDRLRRELRVVDVQSNSVDERFELPWGKTRSVTHQCTHAVVTLSNAANVRWQVELRAYNDGVAFRYRLLQQAGLSEVAIRDEVTRFDTVGAEGAPTTRSTASPRRTSPCMP